MNVKGNSFEDTVAWMRAAGEPTRVRLLCLLDRTELTVSDLVSILNQSQPRISRHLKLLVEAGLAQRLQEGAWAYFKTIDQGPARRFLDVILKPIARDDATILADETKLTSVREERAEKAQAYFAANAEDWGKIRSLHVAEDRVEAAMLELALKAKPESILDLGTGTGRILQLFAPHVERGLGLDTSRDMLAVARSALAETQNPTMTVRQGDVYSLGDNDIKTADRFDLIVLHQVLHFLQDPEKALKEAKGRLSVNGRLLVVDFEAHDFEFLRDEHAHHRLGISRSQMDRWLDGVDMKVLEEQLLEPEPGVETPLTVVCWLAGPA